MRGKPFPLLRARRWAPLVVAAALIPILAMMLFGSPSLIRASAAITFAPDAMYNLGGIASPTSVAIGDMNGDGQPDLVTANGGSDDVSVLLNLGNGVFGAATNFAVGGSLPVAVAIADLNGDGHLDVVTANENSNNISVLLANGLGAPGAPTNYAVGASPDAVAIGNLNGHPDLVVANSQSSSVSVLLGSGTGSFSPATDFAVGSTPNSVAIGDVNFDGKPDVVSADEGIDGVSVLLGTGAGGFALAQNFLVGAGTAPASVAIGNLDADSHLDLVTANSGSNTVSVLPGAGNGTFGAAISSPVNGTRPQSVALGDFNGDGLPDVVAANGGSSCFSSSTISVLPGTGNDNVGPASVFPVGICPASVAVGDLNGDGKPDVVTANSESNGVSVLLNTTVASSPTPTPTPGGGGGGSNSAQVTLAITNGELTASTTAAPSLSATITGQDQTVPYTLPINVIDSTGTGNGWNLTITSTQFSTSSSPANTLPTTASTVISATSVCATGSCTNPTNTVAYPLTIPAGATAPPPVKLFNAATGTGMGAFTVTPSVTILVPGSVLAGTYTSTISLAIVSGP